MIQTTPLPTGAGGEGAGRAPRTIISPAPKFAANVTVRDPGNPKSSAGGSWASRAQETMKVFSVVRAGGPAEGNAEARGSNIADVAKKGGIAKS